MKASEILEAQGWCQWNLARDEYGHPVDVFSGGAVSFCMLGALYVATVRTGSNCDGWAPHEVIVAVHKAIGHLDSSLKTDIILRSNISDWNDDPTRTKEEVIAVLKGLDL